MHVRIGGQKYPGQQACGTAVEFGSSSGKLAVSKKPVPKQVVTYSLTSDIQSLTNSLVPALCRPAVAFHNHGSA